MGDTVGVCRMFSDLQIKPLPTFSTESQALKSKVNHLLSDICLWASSSYTVPPKINFRHGYEGSFGLYSTRLAEDKRT